MTELVAVALLIASGRATSYGPHVMDGVVANRIEWGQVDPDIQHKGYVALLECSHIGRLVWLQHGLKIDGPYMVADCAAGHDHDRLKALGWAVDLSYELALEWGGVDRVGEQFQVWDADPTPDDDMPVMN